MLKLKPIHLSGLLLSLSLLFSCFANGQSSAYNYVVTYTPRVAITDASTLQGATVANVNQAVQYFDALGRPIQTVQTKGSPDQRDVVQPMAYDQYDREAVKYLPYVDSVAALNNGHYRANAISGQLAFYTNPTNSIWNAPGVVQTPFPTSVTAFEPSPLNRPVEQGFQGDNWQLTGTAGATSPGHTQKTVYATNNAAGLPGYWAKDYAVTYLYNVSHQYLYRNALADQGSYAYGTLYVTVTKNENWSSSQTNARLNTTEEYKDKFGHLVLKRTFNHNPATGLDETLSTYYVYDDYGNLTYVLPPGANPDAGGITQAVLDNLCYQYRYDGRNRMIEKKIPGKGWDMTIYNNLNQIIETQDSVQRMQTTQQASFIKYDPQGRVIMSGYTTISGSTPGVDYRATLQAAADAQTALWETKSSTGAYSNVTIPSTYNRLIFNFYDDYSLSALPATYSAPTGASAMTRGLLTISLPVVLNNGDGLWRVNYYDDLGRLIQSYKQHYLGGHSTFSTNNYDLTVNTYNFPNQILTSQRKHYNFTNTSTPKVIIAQTFDYDHVGRTLDVQQQITGSNGVAQGNVYLSKEGYNEVGQVTAKSYNSTDGTNYLVKMGDSFNERGWLTAMTPLSGTTNFGEQIYYNAPTGTATKQYNGNISQFAYNSPQVEVNNGQSSSSLNTVNYAYDNLNRLISAQSTLGKTNESLSYDLEGNIQSLVRTGPTGFALAGTYAYTYPTQSNRLSSVTLNSGANPFRTYAYDGNGNATSDTTGKTLNYNILNLPVVLKQGSNTLATYFYDANGGKLRDVSTNFGTTDYVDGIEYQNGKIAFLQNSEGREQLYSDSITYKYSYNLRDYLGNVRASYDNGGSGGTFREVQENDYYPFGLTQLAYDYSNGNRYLYNGKERQLDLFNKYDYGARFYDPAVARWTVVDPLSEISRRMSPYNYVEDNPVRNIDPDGMSCEPCSVPKFYSEEERIEYENDPPKTNNLYRNPLPNFHNAAGPGPKKKGAGKTSGKGSNPPKGTDKPFSHLKFYPGGWIEPEKTVKDLNLNLEVKTSFGAQIGVELPVGSAVFAPFRVVATDFKIGSQGYFQFFNTSYDAFSNKFNFGRTSDIESLAGYDFLGNGGEVGLLQKMNLNMQTDMGYYRTYNQYNIFGFTNRTTVHQGISTQSTGFSFGFGFYFFGGIEVKLTGGNL